MPVTLRYVKGAQVFSRPVRRGQFRLWQTNEDATGDSKFRNHTFLNSNQKDRFLSLIMDSSFEDT